jgi:hypothetical protein
MIIYIYNYVHASEIHVASKKANVSHVSMSTQTHACACTNTCAHANKFTNSQKSHFFPKMRWACLLPTWGCTMKVNSAHKNTKTKVHTLQNWLWATWLVFAEGLPLEEFTDTSIRDVAEMLKQTKETRDKYGTITCIYVYKFMDIMMPRLKRHVMLVCACVIMYVCIHA